MKKIKYLLHIVLLAGLLTSVASSIVYADIIYPGDDRWDYDRRNSNGTAAITGENPRSGNGSLALTTSGDLSDWAFYSRYAGDTSWGLLSKISNISFDWYREDIGMEGYSEKKYLDRPWLAQTPVLRLQVRDHYKDTYNDFWYTSELVWEKWYTDSSTATTESWVSQNIMKDNFWRHIPNTGYTIYDGTNWQVFSPNALKAVPIYDWANTGSLYSNEALVYGLSIGVGSAWPEEYLGYVDNIRLTFNNINGTVIDDNFEIPVPEPATILLLGTGLVTFAVRHKRRKRQ